MHNRTFAIGPAGSGQLGAILAILAAAFAAAPAAAQGEPEVTPLTPMPPPEYVPYDRDLPYPAFVETTAADPGWVLCTSDVILTTQSCIPNWYDTVISPCYQFNKYWKFSPGVGVGCAAPMAGLGVGSFDGLFVKQGYPVQLFQGSGFTNAYGATDACGIQHAMPLVGPQYVTECFWKTASGNPAPNNFAAGTYYTAGGQGALSSDSIIVGAPLSIVSLDWKDGLTAAGDPVDNNFDVRADYGALLVPNRGPEWRNGSPDRRGQETCYVRNTRPRAEVVFETTPPFSGVATVDVWSEGDIDLTPSGTASHSVTLTFNAQGRATHTFTAYQKTVGATLDLKDFIFSWKGAVYDQQPIIRPAYVLYGSPLDNYNGSAPDNEPLLFHLQMLLGPKVGTRGEWAKGRSSLNKLDLPRAVQLGISGDATFDDEVQHNDDPWNIVQPGGSGICETYAELFKHALLVIGVPTGKLDRKSVVSSVIERPNWLGGNVSTRLLKAFVESPATDAAAWINEGVCGVDTEDEGWQYYDLAGTTAVGIGGWATPFDPSGNNLWYEPTPGQNGPVMHRIVDEAYGTWMPSSVPPYSPYLARPWVWQILIVGLSHDGSSLTVTYRTEGAFYVGTGVRLRLLLYLPGGNHIEHSSHVVPLAVKWGNQQSHTFGSLAAGTYSVSADIETAEGDVLWMYWQTDSPPVEVGSQ